MDTPAQLNAVLTGRYAVEREIGRGGMATVYLARDLRHDRRVALKVLNPELGAVLGVERFLSEIRVTANLQHPNLLPLFDSGEAGGHLFYVMPYVEGESLRARLEREKQLPIDEAVRIALGIASALDYAHAHDVIHRDLKPENILLQHGEPVIADFGIALAVSRAGGARVTQTGLSLGTPQYMSPEQATGDRAIDGRSDIYSLGACLYEMIGGEAPHTGSTGQAIIAKLMTEEPRRLEALRRSVPPHIATTVHKALQKLPADRWRTAKEFAGGLRDTHLTDAAPSAARMRPPRAWQVAAVALAAIAIAEGVALAGRGTAAIDQAIVRFHFVTADSQQFLPTTPAIPFSVSPDARYVAYVGSAPAGRRVYVRDMQTMLTRALPGTDGGVVQPTFSPDGKWVAFVLDGRILRTPVEGGQVVPILALDGRPNAGMAWPMADTLIASIGGVLHAVPASGGATRVLSKADTSKGELQQWGPRYVNERFVAYVVLGGGGVSSNRLGILDRKTGVSTPTDIPCTTVIGAIDDRVVWITPTGTAMVAAIDGSGALGTPRAVLEGVLVRPGGAAKAALSANGSLVYHSGLPYFRLAVSDNKGNVTPLPFPPRPYSQPRWSPDGARIAVTIARSGGSDVWILDTRTKGERKVTSIDGRADQPAWTADGKSITFRFVAADRSISIRRMAADGDVQSVPIITGSNDPQNASLSSDGTRLLFTAFSEDPVNGADLATSAPEPGAKAQWVAHTRGHDYTPQFSPDAKWIAYAGISTGPPIVQVRAADGSGAPVAISNTALAQEPLWSGDGKTLFFRFGRSVYAARLAFTPGPVVQSLGQMFTIDAITDAGYGAWDVTRDGKQFLIMQNVDRQEETIMIHNWAAEVRKLWK